MNFTNPYDIILEKYVEKGAKNMEKELKTLTSEELLELYNKISNFVQFLEKEKGQNEEESVD